VSVVHPEFLIPFKCFSILERVGSICGIVS